MNFINTIKNLRRLSKLMADDKDEMITQIIFCNAYLDLLEFNLDLNKKKYYTIFCHISNGILYKTKIAFIQNHLIVKYVLECKNEFGELDCEILETYIVRPLQILKILAHLIFFKRPVRYIDLDNRARKYYDSIHNYNDKDLFLYLMEIYNSNGNKNKSPDDFIKYLDEYNVHYISSICS
jgi:hypothetical protein